MVCGKRLDKPVLQAQSQIREMQWPEIVASKIEHIETRQHQTKTMNIRTLFSFVMLLATVTTPAFGDTNQPAASGSDCLAKLYYGNEIVLTQPAIQTLSSNAVELLKSSNFNSSNPASRPQHMDISDVHEDYQDAISCKYLLVSFKESQNIKTLGGEVSVEKIIVGLNENFGRNELFTIDDKGLVVSHAKYDGSILLKLLQSVKKIASN
ncbi:MAG TPA: hypothetical protein VE344_06905 [Methylomirabilota bacterium]|nr:hypothetical protein [Methylomirabilota bacterium]